ncbi:MAG: hypothetical protein AAFQ43_04485 [Bacteroidota bacterium]
MRSLVLVLSLVTAVSAAAQEPFFFIGTYTLTDEVPVSVDAASTTRAGAFTPTADPLAFHLNPALLAGVGREGGVSVALDGSSNIGFGSVDALHGAIAAGTTVSVAGQPLAVGAALSRTALDFGTQVWTDEQGAELGTFRSDEATWSAAVGVGWSGPVDLDLGVGLHRRASLPYYYSYEGDSSDGDRVRGVTLDLGTAVTVPVLGRTPTGAVSPFLDLSTGYAQRHLTLATEDLFDRDGVPTTARVGVLGYGARAGLDVALGTGRVRAVELDGRIEGNADLDRFEGSCSGDELPCDPPVLVRNALVGPLGVSNVLLGDGGTHVSGRRALRLTLFDALSITRGHLEGNGYVEPVTSWGGSLDVGGGLRAFGLASGDARLVRTGERLSVRVGYSVSRLRGSTLYSFGGLTVGWRP